MTPCDLCRDGRERIGLVLERRERGVHIAHEGVEVDPRLAPDCDRRVEAVHQQALAAPHAAPQVDAARDRRGGEEAPQRRLARGAERRELVGKHLQALQRADLGVVERRMAAIEQRLEIVDQRALAARDLAGIVRRAQGSVCGSGLGRGVGRTRERELRG